MNNLAENPTLNSTSLAKDWWRGCVIYQVYPRSFRDSNGDGIGDLQGITAGLPHIASLGVDAIWISPFFKSPMADFGYDVEDYRDVDPIFGTLADFDELLNEAHKLGICVIIDLVLSHTSETHPWFIESRGDRVNDKADWYVWADPNEDGTPPNNWLSVFGGSAWQWDARREQYYLHNFLAKQPDLNFHNIDVQDALLDIARFWLERGVDGFRLDTINFYFHDNELRSNPALSSAERNATIAPSVNPYNYQLHLYSKNQPENIAFLERFRALLDEYDARTSLGEVGDAHRGLEILGEYTQGDDRVHMCYAFDLLEKTQPTAERMADVINRFEDVAADGWACWAYSNHDVMRHSTRWALDDAAKRAYLMLMTCLRGSMCLYQGEELGLEEAEVAFEDLQDPYGIEFWPAFKGRDGCRTPMVWEDQDEFAGFSTVKPWLPVSGEQAARAANRQAGEIDSMLEYYKRTIALRRAYPVLAKGDLTDAKALGNVLTFARSYGDETFLCVFNLDAKESTFTAPERHLQHVIGAAPDETGKMTLEAWEYSVLKLFRSHGS
ncbi:alpha-glucosidase [Hoeflea sp.]|uniref:alpha-glucosidase n=1 Tax=Hoeflea sp. TaxID=1940281 RepID=UPI003B01C7AF